jgi:hypothetical protein
MYPKTSSNDTFGEIKFVRPNSWPENEKPYILTYLPTDNFPLTNFDFGDIQNVPIKDMRPIKEKLSLDREGFVVADFASALTYDEYFEEDKLRAVFADELRRFWKDRYGAKAVYIHECVVSTAVPNGPSSNNRDTRSGSEIHYRAKDMDNQSRKLILV